MKLYQVITHPFTLIISFCLILISGQHWGGFYLLYLLLALPHGGAHAVLAFIGMALLIANQMYYHRRKSQMLVSVLKLIGVLLLILSLLAFFDNDVSRYNDGTFQQAGPLVSLILFSVSAVLQIAEVFRKVPRMLSGVR